jgi:type I restriction enzyme S subunit
MNENKKPVIRFSGFTDAWEQRKFTEVFIYLQNNSLSRADLNYEQGLIKNVHYGDVLIKFGEILDVESAELPFISNNEFTVSNTSLLQNGDVVIADAAEDETVGKCSEIKGIEGINVVSGLHTIPCRPNKTFASGYLGYYLNSSAYHDQLLPLIQGTKISSISKSALLNTDIIYPDSEQEQLQIGQFFQSLDNLITLHQRKYDKLQNVKKSMLEKMFPQNGNNTPEIRFKGFNDAWEQRKLGDVVDLRGGRDYKHLSNGDIPVYGTGGYMLSVNEALSYDEDAIGIGRKGTIDKPYILSAPFWTVDTLFYAIPRENYDLDFVFNIFQNIDWKKKDESTGVPSLSKTAINSIEVRTPNYQEQKTIGNYFATLDNLITLHQRELEKLQNIKKSCLERMFV